MDCTKRRAKYLQLQNWLIKAVSRIIFAREAMDEQAIKSALCVWKYVALIFALYIRKKHRDRVLKMSRAFALSSQSDEPEYK